MHDAHHDDHPAEEDAGHDHAHGHAAEGTAGYHPHESPLTMLIPLGVLSLGAIFAGFLFHEAFVGAEEGMRFWAGSIAFDEHLMHAAHEVPSLVKWLPAVVMVTGFAIAWGAYIRNPGFPAAFTAQFRVLYNFVYNKWYFDELYDRIFVQPAFWLGRLFWKAGDVGIIDRLGPNGFAWLVQQGSRGAVKLQSGYLTSYALIMLAGLVGAVSWVIAR